MTELTIFTAPKAFDAPHITAIQRNAIRSWLALGESVQVILMGNDAGVGAVAEEFGALHIPEIDGSEKEVPYIGAMFERARQHSDSPLLAIVNADIILLPDFLEAGRQVLAQRESFVLVGQRWDLDVKGELDFSPGWQDALRSDVQQRGKQHAPAGSDYFLYSRNVFLDVPNFTIGRAGWDNWMIYHANRQSWTILDATEDIFIIHQNHDYSHLPGGEIHYRHPDSGKNVLLGGGAHRMDDLRDLDFALVDGRIVRKPLTWPRLVRKTERWLQPKGPASRLRNNVYRMVKRYRRRIG